MSIVPSDGQRVPAHDDEPNVYELTARVRFVNELARQLHEAGTTAPRLERALTSVGRRLQLSCDVWSSPTAIILSLRQVNDSDGEERTSVLRLAPGAIDLEKLCRVDAIAEQVLRGDMNISEGRAELARLRQPLPRWRGWLEAWVAFPFAAIGVAGLLKGSLHDLLTAAFIGALIGTVATLSGGRARLASALDAIAGLLAAFLSLAVASMIWPISTKLVMLAALIVLVPGLALTSAAVEIATQHLVSGTARLVGAFATLLKLSFGALVGTELARLSGFIPIIESPGIAFDGQEWPSLVLASIAFALLFRARLRDWPIAIGAAWLGYLSTRWASAEATAEFGVFFAAFMVCLVANAYARWSLRPGALVRVPGIILLVPGSIGFRSLSFVMERDVFLGLDTAVGLLLVLASLAAGLLVANTVLPPRNSL
jgi:uncharacterized membrane protein YjjP (DUF1212 family)